MSRSEKVLLTRRELVLRALGLAVGALVMGTIPSANKEQTERGFDLDAWKETIDTIMSEKLGLPGFEENFQLVMTNHITSIAGYAEIYAKIQKGNITNFFTPDDEPLTETNWSNFGIDRSRICGTASDSVNTADIPSGSTLDEFRIINAATIGIGSNEFPRSPFYVLATDFSLNSLQYTSNDPQLQPSNTELSDELNNLQEQLKLDLGAVTQQAVGVHIASNLLHSLLLTISLSSAALLMLDTSETTQKDPQQKTPGDQDGSPGDSNNILKTVAAALLPNIPIITTAVGEIRDVASLQKPRQSLGPQDEQQFAQNWLEMHNALDHFLTDWVDVRTLTSMVKSMHAIQLLKKQGRMNDDDVIISRWGSAHATVYRYNSFEEIQQTMTRGVNMLMTLFDGIIQSLGGDKGLQLAVKQAFYDQLTHVGIYEMQQPAAIGKPELIKELQKTTQSLGYIPVPAMAILLQDVATQHGLTQLGPERR
jgi:hypothetical protein